MKVFASDGATVTLDGEPIEMFVSADDEHGWVRVSATEVRRGKVEIALPLRDAMAADEPVPFDPPKTVTYSRPRGKK